MVDGPVEGILEILGFTAAVAIVIGLVVHAREIVAVLVRVGRRLGVLGPPPVWPAGMPLERIARDLRRLRREALHHQPGVPMARHRGIVAAYEDALLDACRALDVPTDLAALPEGIERESERLRVEAELEQAGVELREE